VITAIEADYEFVLEQTLCHWSRSLVDINSTRSQVSKKQVRRPFPAFRICNRFFGPSTVTFSCSFPK
jgi:hypothetical protein